MSSKRRRPETSLMASVSLAVVTGGWTTAQLTAEFGAQTRYVTAGKKQRLERMTRTRGLEGWESVTKRPIFSRSCVIAFSPSCDQR